MFNKLRSYIAAGALALALSGGVLGMLLAPLAVQAQPYPTNNPSYQPNPILGSTGAIPTAQGSSYVFQINGVETLYLRIAGAPSGLAAYMQGSEGRNPLTIAATVTISNASPGVVTWTAHGLSVNQPVVLTSTGGLPTGLTAGTTYYVIAAGLTANAFELAATPGGTAINTSSAGSGTQTGTSTSVQWANIAVDKISSPAGGVGGPRQTQINGAGLYRLNVSGYGQVRLNVQALTSGVTYADFSAGPGASFVTTAPNLRNSYSASVNNLGTGATNHFLVLPGNTTTTVRVTNARCSGRATGPTGLTLNITGELSAADTGDAGTALTSTPHDSNNPAAASVVLTHTTSPTPGALIGNVRSGVMQLGMVSDTATDFPTPTEINWDFGTRPWEQEIVLRGVAQLFSLDTNAAFGAGAVVSCSISWTEELN